MKKMGNKRVGNKRGGRNKPDRVSGNSIKYEIIG